MRIARRSAMVITRILSLNVAVAGRGDTGA